jgi:RNA-directed DNA polymerase
MRKVCIHSYHDIISVENLLLAWQEFIKGKRGRKDVQVFERDLMKNILDLHRELISKTYKHSEYEAFKISDPKPRNINKASVKDRLLHHAIYQILYPFFDSTFAADSYSCRKYKGVHKALNTFKKYNDKASNNQYKNIWILKCDIKKFFASIDHIVLEDIICEYIKDEDVQQLLYGIIESFSVREGKGLPLGNLTSQLFVNVYMNEFDQFVKHKLKVKYYVRYSDDFVITSIDKKYLERLLLSIDEYLNKVLKLKLHPMKVSIETSSSGVDFLGWVHFPDHRVLRLVTKKRMIKGVMEKFGKEEIVQSYLGLLSHGNTCKLQKKVRDLKQIYSELD